MWPLRKTGPDGFAELLETHLDGMYRLALSLTRSSPDAQDLVHDTAARALRFKDRFRAGSNFRAWVHTILYNIFRNQYQRRVRERRLFDDANRHDVEDGLCSESSRERASAPENTYLDTMLSDDILRALHGLPEDQRAVVMLCDVDGLSYKEIADVLDCPVGTVMSRLFRGRQRLQKTLRGVAVAQGIVKEEHRDTVIDIARYRRSQS